MREVFRDHWLLVVDKPADLPTQAPRGEADHVVARLRRTEAYVGLHHRLDAAASGLLLIAVDRAANAALADAFRNHRIERTYLAIGGGAPDPGP